MEETARTVRNAVEAYLASRDDLRSTTADGHRLVAEERVYGPYGGLPAGELPRIAAELAAGERDDLDARASKLLMAVAGWMTAQESWAVEPAGADEIEWLEDGRLKVIDGNESAVIAAIARMIAPVYDELGDDGSAGFAAACAARSLRVGETEIADADVNESKERRLSELLVEAGASKDMSDAAARAAAKYVHEDYPVWKDRR